MCSKMSRRPWHTHSLVSPAKSWQKPMLEKGKLSTRKCILTRSPPASTSTSPKSACASPGAQTSSI